MVQGYERNAGLPQCSLYLSSWGRYLRYTMIMVRLYCKSRTALEVLCMFLRMQLVSLHIFQYNTHEVRKR